MLILRQCSLGQEIELRLINDATVELGMQRVLCELVNPSLHSIEYSESFYLEHLSTSGWESVNDLNRNVNFQLPLYTLRPLGSETIEFSLDLYSDMNRPGTYRIVLPVTIHQEAQNLYCQFTVE